MICSNCGEEGDTYKKHSRQCKKCTIKRNEEYRKRKVLEFRKIIFTHYGNACTCCGERNIKFLTIDHINGGGLEHKKKIANGRKAPTIMFYRWIIKNNFPDDLRLMCWNCNCGRQFNDGICPHKEIT